MRCYRVVRGFRAAFRSIDRQRLYHFAYRDPLIAARSVPCRASTQTLVRGHSSLQTPREYVPETFDDPTIYALSTAPGRAAIAIIRISGSACRAIYHSLCPGTSLPQPRYAAVRTLYEPVPSKAKRSVLDSNALILYFPAPRTATGEDILELHIHGGPAIVKAVLAAIATLNAPSQMFRYAEPGEFTRRAFLNDRLDLPQIEALGDTLNAVTEEQRRLSVQGTTSGLAKRYEEWRKMLLYARGELEALIDFSEDQHFDESPADLAGNVAVQVRALVQRIGFHRANAVRGELLRSGISISLIGAPNVGKSSLLNLVVGRNAAIVSQEAGTTRDIVEVGVDLGGFFCRFGDTAGLRQSKKADAAGVMASVVGEIEKEGIRRAKERALESDVVLIMLSVEPSIQGQGAGLALEPEVLETAKQLMDAGKQVVVIVNKMDHYSITAEHMQEDVVKAVTTVLPGLQPERVFCLSCRSAETHASAQSTNDPGGVQAFLRGLTTTFMEMTTVLSPGTTSDEDPSQWHESLGATQRQSTLLEECQRNLVSFLSQVEIPSRSAGEASHIDGGDEADIDIVAAAESLRAAADCLGKITGRGEVGDTEEVLGVVFEK